MEITETSRLILEVRGKGGIQRVLLTCDFCLKSHYIWYFFKTLAQNKMMM